MAFIQMRPQIQLLVPSVGKPAGGGAPTLSSHTGPWGEQEVEPESSPPRLTPARPDRVFGTGGCRSRGAARGCSGSKDQARPGRLEPAGPANRGPAGASPADWAPRGPAPSRPRPPPGLLEPHPLRPGLRGRAARGRGRSPQSCPPAGTGVGGRGRSLGWGKTPGRWAGRRDKLGHWKTDWSSFFATTPAALRGLLSVSLSLCLPLPFIFSHHSCHSSEKHAPTPNIRSRRDSCNSGDLLAWGSRAQKAGGETLTTTTRVTGTSQ